MAQLDYLEGSFVVVDERNIRVQSHGNSFDEVMGGLCAHP